MRWRPGPGVALLVFLVAQARTAGAPAEDSLQVEVDLADVGGKGTGAVTLDLPAVLERAGRQNLDVRISEAVSAEAEGERQSARAAWWPDLTLGALTRHTDGTLQGTFGDFGTTVFSTALANAILRWDLNPGATHFRRVATREQAAGAQANVLATRLQVQETAAARYLELVGAAALATVARHTRDDASEFLKLTRVLEEKGLGLGADVQRARAELARREGALALARRAFRIASARLAEALDLDPAATILPADETIMAPELPAVDDVSELLTRALASRQEMIAATREVGANESRLSALRWQAYGPNVALEAQQGYIGPTLPETSEQSFYCARVGWTIRPSDVGAQHAARARLERARLEQERTRLRIAAEVVEGREAVTLAGSRLLPAREALEAAEQALHFSQVRFGGGIGNALEVLQAQDAVAAARAEAVSVLVEAHEAVYRLRRVLGMPLDIP